MPVKVKKGDTLGKIAKANGVTLAKLKAANPQITDANKIKIGQSINLPGEGGQPTPTQPTQPSQPSQPPPAPTPPPAPGKFVLGTLSAKFETGGRGPGTVSTGIGDRGGVSYGSYQMTSKPGGGTVRRFVSQADFPFKLRFAGLTPGSKAFTDVWKSLARSDRNAFQESQHGFIKKTHFDPLVAGIRAKQKVDIETRSHALQDVIWSTAVQHGPGTPLVGKAFVGLGVTTQDPDFDERLIRAIYAQRGRKRADGALALFSKNSPAVQRGVANRFRDELRDALAMLASVRIELSL